ncbi:PROX1 [Cordylochernes scorpioides]|uniref:PROX1 n=1 Tax=Cordylochernes scorpioides TaxID=51811 RepID=A0ABY6LE04_9ARAC|nr:PROX1 [Cordylochernes scorpioides]
MFPMSSADEDTVELNCMDDQRLLLKKGKRQRVDAGEPRNTYSRSNGFAAGDNLLLRDILQQGRKAGSLAVSPGSGGNCLASSADRMSSEEETAASPVTPVVNGCKKRKLYQPQQHDATHLTEEEDEEELVVETKEELVEDEEDDEIEERAHLRTQLRDVQAQLAAMQHRNPDNCYPTSDYRNVEAMSPLRAEEATRSADLEWFIDSLKAELSNSMGKVIDAVFSRYLQRRSATAPDHPQPSIPSPNLPPPPPPQQAAKELLAQMLDRKSPRTKVIDRGLKMNGHHASLSRYSPYSVDALTKPYQHYYHVKSMWGPSAFEPEQTEAMALVVAPKKRRHKVTDTRLGIRGRYDEPLAGYPPPPLVPASLPTSVAIPNPSLDAFHHHHHDEAPGYRSSPEPPPQVPAYHYPSPFSTPRPHGGENGANTDTPNSDRGDSPLGQTFTECGVPMISFLISQVLWLPFFILFLPHFLLLLHYLSVSLQTPKHFISLYIYQQGSSPTSLTPAYTSTLTPMHLRKAKLMFFYVRYPSSAILKMYFPDIKFNKNNTAQLVKWFSNFR